MARITTKYHWMSWTAAMLRHLRSGDITGTATTLACCLPCGETFPADERRSFEKMFRHAELEGRHWELWAAMKPLIYSPARGSVRKTLLGIDWKIRPEDKVVAMVAA